MNIIKDADVLSVENLFKDKYIIPLYQRNFAWGEEQISRLLQDIYESMCSGDEHFYVGSLIVLQRGCNPYLPIWRRTKTARGSAVRKTIPPQRPPKYRR